MKKLLRIAVSLVGLLAAIVLALYLLVLPRVVRAEVVKQVGAQWGDRVEVEAAHWDFGPSIEIRGLRLYRGERCVVEADRAVAVFPSSPPEGQPTEVRLYDVTAHVDLDELTGLRGAFPRIILERGEVVLRREGESLRIAVARASMDGDRADAGDVQLFWADRQVARVERLVREADAVRIEAVEALLELDAQGRWALEDFVRSLRGGEGLTVTVSDADVTISIPDVEPFRLQVARATPEEVVEAVLSQDDVELARAATVRREGDALFVDNAYARVELDAEGRWVLQDIVDRFEGRGRDFSLAVSNSRADVVLTNPEGLPYTVPVEDLSVKLQRRGQATELTSLVGRAFGGSVTAFGTMSPDDWRLQGNLKEVDLALAVAGTQYAQTDTRGRMSAFVEVLRGPVGAGWVRLHDARVWELPAFAGVLRELGLLAGKADEIEKAEGIYRIDRGHVYFTELKAVGTPVCLFGSGQMKLDGTELSADFIPRLGERELEDLPLIGAPTQALLDVAKGAAVQVRVRGTVRQVDVTTQPLPVVTDPIRDFFDWVGGED